MLEYLNCKAEIENKHMDPKRGRWGGRELGNWD